MNREEDIVFSYVKGNSYLEESEDMKMVYVTGLIDMLYYILYRLQPEVYKEYLKVIGEFRNKQIMEIYDKYLENHPEELDYICADSFMSTIEEIFYK
jgi:hypothetical protein